nr:hypothetical protein [Methylomarinum sp. Ch1-1]MDP4520918.1 hypothetical protein [Methylomarinum sp. Ch1-1]
MNELYKETLKFMEHAVNYFSGNVPPPKQVPFKDSFVFRYEEQSILQAIVQKLARMVTSLHSIKVLTDNGLFQDQAAIQRMLDEFQEDILFLVYGLTNGEITQIHKDYLDEFYKEEFDNQDSALKSTQKRGMVSRKKFVLMFQKLMGKN